MGATAIRIHSPKFLQLHYRLGRELSDIDFIAYGKDTSRIEEFFTSRNYEMDRYLRLATRGSRSKFYNAELKLTIDVFYDRLDMCHVIDFANRLEIDYPTISLADLLLEKMQIVRLTSKDIKDSFVLLREHDIGEHDRETINIKYIAKLCCNDWGLWKTMTMNLQKIRLMLSQYEVLREEDRVDIANKLDLIVDAAEKGKKSMGWKMRSRIGERKKWYKEVEEIVE